MFLSFLQTLITRNLKHNNRANVLRLFHCTIRSYVGGSVKANLQDTTGTRLTFWYMKTFANATIPVHERNLPEMFYLDAHLLSGYTRTRIAYDLSYLVSWKSTFKVLYKVPMVPNMTALRSSRAMQITTNLAVAQSYARILKAQLTFIELKFNLSFP